MSTFQKLSILATFDNTKSSVEDVKKKLEDRFLKLENCHTNNKGDISVIELCGEESVSYSSIVDFNNEDNAKIAEELGLLSLVTRSRCLDYQDWDECNGSSDSAADDAMEILCTETCKSI